MSLLEGAVSQLTAACALLDRIDAKLDTLIQALADEGEDEGRAHDLDGNTLHRNREEWQAL